MMVHSPEAGYLKHPFNMRHSIILLPFWNLPTFSSSCVFVVSNTFQKSRLVVGSPGFHNTFSLTCHRPKTSKRTRPVDILPSSAYPDISTTTIIATRVYLKTFFAPHGYFEMTGTRRSSRRRYAVLEKVEPSHNQEQRDPKSNYEGSSTHNEEESNIKDPDTEVIGGVRRNANDDGLDYYYTKADKWVPGDEVSPQMLSIWAKTQVSPPRPGPEPDAKVKDVKRDLTGNLIIHYREKGRNKADNAWPFQWVPVCTASPILIFAWAKVEKERVERSIRYLKEHQISVSVTKRLHMLDDLLDGETMDPVKPDWMPDASSSDSSSSGSSSPDSSSPDQDTKMPSHPPHFPLPTLFKGNCNNTSQSPATHTNLVAACQAGNHFPNAITPNVSPHLVCTTCHENSPLQRLTQRERDHMIRDKGIFPLCSTCTDVWCEHHHIDPEEVIDNCTCEIQLPQWLCSGCWVEMARARTHRADACTECSEVRTGREVKGEDVVGEDVHMCSGCLALVAKGGDEYGSSVSADE
jgi:hypothetical protein